MAKLERNVFGTKSIPYTLRPSSHKGCYLSQPVGCAVEFPNMTTGSSDTQMSQEPAWWRNEGSGVQEAYRAHQ